MEKRPVILVVMDGIGIREDKEEQCCCISQQTNT